MVVGINDSTEKLLSQITSISLEKISYNDNLLNETVNKKFKIGKSFWRKFICAKGCTACCLNFSLDYIPKEFELYVDDNLKSEFKERKVTVNGKEIIMYSVLDNFRDTGKCIFLIDRRTDDKTVPGCNFYPNPPLSCLSAPQILFTSRSNNNTGYLLKKIFGRYWNFEEEVQCEFKKDNNYDYSQELHILKRFKWWIDYFEIDTMIDDYISLIDSLKERNISKTIELKNSNNVRKQLKLY
ncbi:MAG: hypothetical protein ACOCRK_11640 [bacterium]